jgi:hypothetical protein
MRTNGHNEANRRFTRLCKWAEILLTYSLKARWRSWLRHCIKNRKVAGSIPDDVLAIFHWHNTSGRTMALGSTQPLTEMSTRKFCLAVKAAGAYGFMCRLSRNLGASTSWNPVGLSRPVMGQRERDTHRRGAMWQEGPTHCYSLY